MAKINSNYQKLPGSYLFSEIARRVAAYSAENPDKKIIRLGIGDVTLPLADAVIQAMHKAVDEIFQVALDFGGTLSGEHGIGMAKMRYLGNELGDSGLNLLRSIKESLDPDYLLNPGKMVPVREV